MSVRKVLLQFDTDPKPSSFDAIVAIDAGVDCLLTYQNVTPETVEPLVHGALFTRAPGELKHTAIFVGGSQLELGERVLARIVETFFGPFRVSAMLDPGGANTTAAAAVLRVAQHVALPESRCLVLGGTGPVGRRVARLLASEGAYVLLGSRRQERATEAWQSVEAAVPTARGEPCETAGEKLAALVQSVEVIISAGAAGVQLLAADRWQQVDRLRVVVDLNAVPPVGIEGVEPADKGTERHGTICYGALGVGGLKMRIHRRAIARLFEANDLILDAESILQLGKELS